MFSSAAPQALALLRITHYEPLADSVCTGEPCRAYPTTLCTDWLHFMKRQDQRSDVTQPVMLGHKSRVAGPEAMSLGNARLGTPFLKHIPVMCFSGLILDLCSLSPSPTDHVESGATEGDCTEATQADKNTSILLTSSAFL